MSQGLFDLSSCVAVVTGSSGQLGQEYVRALLGAGASVAGFDVQQPSAIDGQHQPEESERFLYLEVDVTSKASLESGLRQTCGRLGIPTILVNNAAIDAPPGATDRETGPFEEYPEASWDEMMRINLKGMFLACQVIGGAMAESGRGSIVNIASIYGILSPDQRIYEYRAESTGRPFYKPVAYSVTKSGVLNLTRYLATYWADRGVRVNTLTLGGVYNGQDETFVRNYSSKVPLGRMARSDEYNAAVLFLSSDASSYMTGSNLIIDGGFSCW